MPENILEVTKKALSVSKVNEGSFGTTDGTIVIHPRKTGDDEVTITFEKIRGKNKGKFELKLGGNEALATAQWLKRIAADAERAAKDAAK